MLVSELLKLFGDETINVNTIIRSTAHSLRVANMDQKRIVLTEYIGMGEMSISDWLIPLADGEIVGSTEIKMQSCGNVLSTEFVATKEKLIIKEV